MNNGLVVSSLEIRSMMDFVPLPSCRLGGSSAVLQCFQDLTTAQSWIGKCSNQALFREPIPGYGRYYEEYREWLGLMLYRLFGVPTPEVCLSVLPIRAQRDAAVDLDWNTPRLHLMTKYVHEFHSFGDNFLLSYRKSHRSQVECSDGKIMPLQGFGNALAVAYFISDLDCLGRSGGNMGYVPTWSDSSGYVGQTFKIDSGFAFSFMDNIDDPSYHDDPRSREIRFAPGRLADGQKCVLRFNDLTKQDRQQFAMTLRRILQTPSSTLKVLIDQVVIEDGFTHSQADALLTGLLARKTSFLEEFAAEISGELRFEALHAKELYLKQFLETRLKGSVKSNADYSKNFTEQIGRLQQERLQLVRAHLCQIKRGNLPRAFQLPSVVPHFSARDDELTRLTSLLNREQVATVTITGLGGVGKTQLVARYCQAALNSELIGSHRLYYDSIIWLFADQDVSLQFRVFAELFGDEIRTTDEAVQTVRKKMKNKRILVVFDNVETINATDLLSKLCAREDSECCHVLITTRDVRLTKDVSNITVKEFSDEGAIKYVQTQLEIADESQVKTLLATVTCLPLVLSQAISFIAAGYSSLSEYPQHFVLHQLTWSIGRPPLDLEDTLLTTFLLTVARIESEYPGTLSLLCCCAYLNAEDIPLPLIRTLMPEQSTPVELLIREGLLRPGEERDSVNIHRLLQRCLHHSIPNETRKSIVKLTMKAFLKVCSREFEAVADKNRWALIRHAKALICHDTDLGGEKDAVLDGVVSTYWHLVRPKIFTTSNQITSLKRFLRTKLKLLLKVKPFQSYSCSAKAR